MQTTVYRLQQLFLSLVIMLLCSSQTMIAVGKEMGGPRGGEVVRGPSGDVAVEGPRGNVAVGTRYNQVPNLANTVIVDGQTYYVDDNGVYYLPCADDNTVYCVVPAPQDN
jgi:hypothetical protein